MATIDDVARLAGVSKSSVSRVINGNYQFVTEELKQNVLKAIDELDYSPNSLAQSLKNKKTHIIGIVLSDIGNPFWMEVLRGAQAECMNRGYGLMMSNSAEDPDTERENILMLRGKQVDGLIINTTGKNTQLFSNLRRTEIPVVFLDRIPDGISGDTITVDNLTGGFQATESLIKLGHRRIGIVSYPLTNNSPRQMRLKGYKNALLQNGIEIDEDLIKICGTESGSGLKATLELLQPEKQVTAIFSTNTYLNLDVLKGIKKLGLRIPQNISVIGYDDFDWVPLLDPPLSTVAQPAYELGVQAAAMVNEKIKYKNKNAFYGCLEMMPQLIIRESCAEMRPRE